MPALIHLENLSKVFNTEEVETHALAGIHLDIERGEFVSIVGPSFSRIFDAEIGPFGKFKHIIEPRIDYAYVSEVSDPTRIPAYDEIDLALGRNEVRYAIVNRLLARPADPSKGSAIEIASLQVSQTYAFELPQTGLADTTLQPLTTKRGPVEGVLRLAPADPAWAAWGWLGVRIRDLSEQEMEEISQKHGLREGFGVVIVEVMKETPAEGSGLQPGDLIVGFRDRPVVDTRTLQRLIAHTTSGDTVGLTILRREEGRRRLSVRVGAMPDAVAADRVAAEFGFLVRDPDGQVEESASRLTSPPTVSAILAKSPAEKAGLLAGDTILAVDGSALDGLTVDAARDRVRGPKDTTVVLTISRGNKAPFDVSIVRGVIAQREVIDKVLANGAIGYIRVTGFSDNSATQFHTVLKADVAAGRKEVILDLRGNPGGYVTAARSIASEFLAAGPLFWEETADGTQTETDAATDPKTTGAATDPAIRLVVLIDGGSASASEIVTGALHDRGRATIVGQTSFGKGTVQQWIELPKTGALKLTIAKWLTPNKTWIHHVGIVPDVVVTPPADLPAGQDPTLDKAVELLNSGASPTPSG